MKILKFLLIFVPISAVLELMHMDKTFIFIASALAIIPLAGIMGEATENLAHYAGPKVGGFLNATFGNATELIIAALAIKEGLPDVAKASLAGSIIGNILLVLGASMLFGGLKHKTQTFNKKSMGNSGTLLLFSIIGLVIPAVFFFNASGSDLTGKYEGMNILVACIMLFIYVLGLFFTFFTHKDILGSEHSESTKVNWSLKKSIIVLFIATILVALESEFLVGTIESIASTLGWSEMFIGIIVLAIIGNAAEHSTAILMAMKNKMDIAVEIAIGSSLQIALFVIPTLVLFSLAIGKPMSIIFNPYELVAIIFAVWIANNISHDGESNWLEGVQLIAVYGILAASFFFVK
jgi:Ca2+:H+ antiporter